MRKVATHRVYDAVTGKTFSKQVVELDNQGYVVKIYPFSDEIRYTEWLGDIIIVSPSELPAISSDESYSQYKERISSFIHPIGEESLKKAYWLTPFNVSSMDFTSETHIIVCKSR